MTKEEMIKTLRYKSENIKAHIVPEFFLIVADELEKAYELDLHEEDLQKSIEINGEVKKKIICMEEPAELIKAISKDLRGKLDRDNMVEEMADVLICVTMLKLMHGVSDEELQHWIDYKVERQKERDNGTGRSYNRISCKSAKCENCINHNYCDFEPQESEDKE